MVDLIMSLSGFILGAINAVLAMFGIEAIVIDEKMEESLRKILETVGVED